MKRKFAEKDHKTLATSFPCAFYSGYGESFANIFLILHLIKMFASVLEIHVIIYSSNRSQQKCKNYIFCLKTTCKDIFYNVFLSVKLPTVERRTANANIATVRGSIPFPAQWNPMATDEAVLDKVLYIKKKT
jgi:hypothetical protein